MVKIITAAALAALLSACAGAMSGGMTGYRDVTGQDRRQQALDQSVAECDWELAKLTRYEAHSTLQSTLLSGPGPAVHERCMRARGWQLVGRQ